MQLYFRDDGGFLFRQLDIEDSFLIEKDKHGAVEKAWLMFYKLLKKFEGFKDIPAGSVTLSYGRDILFDPFDQLKPTEKPGKGMKLKQSFVSKIAEAVCYKWEQNPGGDLVFNRAVVSLGIVMTLLGLTIGVVAIW